MRACVSLIYIYLEAHRILHRIHRIHRKRNIRSRTVLGFIMSGARITVVYTKFLKFMILLYTSVDVYYQMFHHMNQQKRH